jgi:transketolase
VRADSVDPVVPDTFRTELPRRTEPLNDANQLSYEIRRLVLDCSKRANVGHIGSSLSIADIVAALYAGVLRGEPENADRDRFILSKGHAAPALYAALVHTGVLERQDLDRFCGEGTELGAHPEQSLSGVDFATGSLGHGLSYATGAALAARMQGSARRVFVLLSDAECNEGSVWEAVMFGAHHRLGNLVAIVDVNGQQALGQTRDVLDLEPLVDRWRSFGWDAHELDGHDTDTIASTIASLDFARGAPHVVLARTTFGRGVSYMEGQLAWHYWPMSDDQYRQALDEIAGRERDRQLKDGSLTAG